MNPSKWKKLIAPIIVLVIAAIAAVSVTVVVLTGKKDNSHIRVEEPIETVQGELEIKLVRERLEVVTLDADGLPYRNASDEFADFSATDENIFGIKDDTLIGPECYFAANMAISNDRPYDFEYWLEIVPQKGENLLVEQLELKITLGEELFVQRTLQSGLTTKIFPPVASGDTSRFGVRLTYLDVEDNDLTKNTTLKFDMVVHARLI